MQYALLIYAEPGYSDALPEAERAAMVTDYSALADDPRCLASAQLHPVETATCVRVVGGRTLMTDGPFGRHQGGARRRQRHRGGQPGRGDRAGRARPGRAARRSGGGPAGGAALSSLEDVFRDEWGRVLATLVGFLGDFDKAEEATREAFAIAAQRWPGSGWPANPGAWLTTTARNQAIDRVRRERVLAEKIQLVASWREATVFTPAERAALELAEQGTRIADAGGGVTDEAWANAAQHCDEGELDALISVIAVINAYNRVNVIARTPAGDYQPGQFG